MSFSLANALTIDEKQFSSLMNLVEERSKSIEDLKFKVNLQQVEISQLQESSATNQHKHTQPLRGVFTVPREGLYMFYLAFGLGGTHSRTNLQIVVDGKEQVSGVADTLTDLHDAQGGNMVLRHLQAGDSVWVNVFRWNDVHVFGGVGYTTFSGILLFEY